MNITAILLAISSLASIVVFGIVAAHHTGRRHRALLFYLALVLVSSLGSFIIEAGFLPNQPMVWHRGLLVVFVSTSVVYYHFVRVFLGKTVGWIMYLAYTGVIVLATLVSVAGMFPTFRLSDDNLSVYLTAFFGFLFLGIVIRSLVQGFRKANDPYLRNVLVYLLVGVSVLALSAGINLILAREQYYLPPISNLLNALIVCYAILKTHPNDATFMIRRGLAFLFAMLCISGVFSSVIYLYYDLLPDQPGYGVVLLLSSCALLLALATRPLRLTIEKWLDWLFYRRTSRYRETLIHFGSKLGSIVNLDELAGEILPTLSKALRVKKVMLLIEDNKDTFTAQYTYLNGEEWTEEKLCFSADSPLVSLLGRGNTFINLDQIGDIPELMGLHNSKIEQINTSKLNLLCPIKSRGKLVGMLALEREHSGTVLSYRDTQLIMATTGQIGVLIENARLYSQALSWALTDGLTGLYNHRHFQKSLEQEIARCSRHNSVFSLIMLDIDHFKAYNDTFGHPAGDTVLEGVGECILESIRTEDTACRYGGEEFVVILPDTKIEKAYNVAERIRNNIERNLSSEMVVVTASFGVSSWSDEGVTGKDVVACADAALYLAKQTGRNRTCLSSNQSLPERNSPLMLSGTSR
ncbi:diguanylate cyclase [Chloroflexota bacterium]